MLVDEVSEQLTHGSRIAPHDGSRGRDITGGVQALPGKRESRIVGKLREERALGPAVAFAERMDGINLAEVVSQPI
jgi:hypothetical protein